MVGKIGTALEGRTNSGKALPIGFAGLCKLNSILGKVAWFNQSEKPLPILVG
jgi:hypothetical protein